MKRPTKLERLRGTTQELITIVRRGRQVWRLVTWRHRLFLMSAIGVMCLAGAANTVAPLALGRLIDVANPSAHPESSPDQLGRAAAVYLLIIAGAYLVRESMNVLRRYLVENACTRIDKDMYVRIVSHLMKVDLDVLGRDQVGGTYGRINRSVEGLVRFLRVTFLEFVPALLTGGFALAAALSQRPEIAIAMMGVAPISLGITVWQIVTQKGVRIELLRTREKMDGTVVEQLGGLDYVRAANTHRHEARRIERAAERRRGMELRHHFEMSLFGAGKALNEGLFHVVVLAVSLYFYIHGQIGPGDVVMFSALFLSVMTPLSEVHRFIDEAHESGIRVGDLVGLLTTPVDRSFRRSRKSSGAAPAAVSPRPEVPTAPRLALGAPLFVAEDLHVVFPSINGAGGPARPALDGLSVVVRHGETIGVAGRSGCGKTTWLRTIMRLTHPRDGRAWLAGVPLEDVSRKTIGDLIGHVGQVPFVFAGTIAQNIAYGCPGATEGQILQAARMACVHEEILRMPGGYRARVAERGRNLSGGQRQRIALARVFLKGPPVLVLDEGTSALDNTSERLIQEAIETARADRTVILVAHRLTTLRAADRILVFEDGRIVEDGAYDELIERGGKFSALVEAAEGERPERKRRLVVGPAPARAREHRPSVVE